jgi:hypothetical protein
MLDDVQDQILAWLDHEPAIAALEILRRLKSVHPERFSDSHLRTVQRAVKAWRGQQARRIILEGAIVVGTGACDPLQAEHVTPPPPDPHPRVSTTGAHSYSPRIAASDSWQSLRDARVPSVDSMDDTPLPHQALGNIVG